MKIIKASKTTSVTLKDYVGQPFDLYDEDVQYAIVEWAVDKLISELNKKFKRQKRSFYPDDISWSAQRIYFQVYEDDGAGGDYIGDFNSRLNFYDGESESYEDVEYLINDNISDFLRNMY